MGKQPEIKEVGAPAWVVTFTDLTSLLTTFFVLLLTFSTMEPVRVRQVQSYLKGSIGVFGRSMLSRPALVSREVHTTNRARKGRETPPDPEADVTDAPPRLPEGLVVTEGDLDKGMRIRFKTLFPFPLGEARPSAALRKALQVVGAGLRGRGLLVRVEGYPDKVFHESLVYATPLELSLERALQAERILVEAGVDPESITIAGMPGGEEPAGVSGDEDGRETGRVELVIRGGG